MSLKIILLIFVSLIMLSSSVAQSPSDFERSEPRFDYDYSSVIASTDNQRIIPFVIRNPSSDTKNLRTEIENTGSLNAEFVSGGKTKTYSLTGGTENRLVIRLNPDSIGTTKLNVTTTNTDLDLSNTQRIPVMVKEFPSSYNANEVSGIGIIHLAGIMLAGSIAYFSLL